ncbi:hypothetical protein J1614_001046 [Plenodomus biglobosus]|nr:hypothetical protein J1614_001046 [Plenodomus biglobosus]
MAWQLRNPDATDPAEAIEAVKVSQGTKNHGELSSRLASHFLQLTVPRCFPQNKSALNALEVSRRPAPWRDAGNGYVLELLKWSIGALSGKEIERLWRFLMPPILQMIDDSEVESQAKGCELLTLLLQQMQQATGQDTFVSSKSMKSSEATNFLQRTGYHSVLADSLFPLLTHLPSLTPEQESITLLSEVYPALLLLAQLVPADTNTTPSNPTTSSPTKTWFLDKIVREGIFHPLAHFPTPSTYPHLANLIVSQLPKITDEMGIESIKHLPDIITLISSILQEPFALSHEALVLSTLQALRSIMQNAWPRIPRHRGSIMMGLGVLWGRVLEERKEGEADLVMRQIQETAEMLDAIMRASEESEVWAVEKTSVEGVSDEYGGIFGQGRRG